MDAKERASPEYLQHFDFHDCRHHFISYAVMSGIDSMTIDRILAAKARDAAAGLSELEREIDQLVYALYSLTPEETNGRAIFLDADLMNGERHEKKCRFTLAEELAHYLIHGELFADCHTGSG